MGVEVHHHVRGRLDDLSFGSRLVVTFPLCLSDDVLDSVDGDGVGIFGVARHGEVVKTSCGGVAEVPKVDGIFHISCHCSRSVLPGT